jgi:hypothetical protein
VGIIRGSSFVAVGLERQDAFETYERRIVSNVTHFISQWQFFIICDSCSHGLQVQNAETIITSTYAHGNLIQNTTDDVPSNFLSSPYPSLNPPRLDTLTIQIIGNINAFWFFGGRIWYWVFTPVWSKVEFTPADISQEPTVPEQIEVPDSSHNQPIQDFPPILPPTSKAHSLPKWAWAIALGSVTLNVLAILACVGYRIHRIRSNHYSRASESEYEKLKMDSNRE